MYVVRELRSRGVPKNKSGHHKIYMCFYYVSIGLAAIWPFGWQAHHSNALNQFSRADFIKSSHHKSNTINTVNGADFQ